MNYRKGVVLLGIGAALFSALYAAKRPFRAYPSMEPYDDVELPPDFNDQSEWVFARLMYPQHPRARFGGYRRFGGRDSREGATSQPQDYTSADRPFLQAP